VSKQHRNVAALRSIKRNDYDPDDGSASGEALAWAIRVCEAADNLVNVKGRHHSELAYKRLEDAVNGD
jgi:hypothetical protein